MRADLRGIDLALQQNTDGHLHDGLHTGLLIAVHLVHANIVLAVAGSGERGHDGRDKRTGSLRRLSDGKGRESKIEAVEHRRREQRARPVFI